MHEKILSFYPVSSNAKVTPYGNGLINRTWKVSDTSQEYILQKINQAVFTDPAVIAENIEAIADALRENHPGYCFLTPIRTTEGKPLAHIPGEGYYRLFPFVKDSVTYDVAITPDLAFEAGQQFGRFTALLREFPADRLKTTVPHFHDLRRRYAFFEESLEKGNKQRIAEANGLIAFLQKHKHIVHTYDSILSRNDFKLRVTHHDTKISNVLFDRTRKGICVIDLDTVMPGYFISDAGDMMRTYLSPVSEEEKDLEKIVVRDEFFAAIAAGYLGEMRDELTAAELDHFVYAGMFMIYMQSLRFLTDYLNDDIYYGALYEKHNYVRAKNQAVLLKRLMEKEKKLKEIERSVYKNG